jgi:hypothetical protein
MVDSLYKEKNLKHYLSDVNKFVSDIAANYDNMHHLFAIPQTFNASVMQNVDHLTTEAAQVYTLRLLENLECNNL